MAIKPFIKQFLLSIVVVGGLFVFSIPATAAVAKVAETVQAIKVEGNQRIETSTIVSYLEVKEGDPLDAALLDNGLKNLYATGLFKDVTITPAAAGEILVKVSEKPIINEIIFEGNDEIKSEDLAKEISLKPRQVISVPKVQEDVNRMKELYRMSGRFGVSVDPQMIELDQNRVNLIFEIKEGEKTLISRINFMGNKEYSDAELQEVVRSKESRWYRFLSADDKYDPDRLSYDQELLRKFYLEHGYVDFKASIVMAELSPEDKNFFVTFDINEGDRYKIGDVTIKTTIPDLNVNDLKDAITLEKGKWYNLNEVEKTTTKMTSQLGNLQFAFVDIKPGVNRDKVNKVVNIEFMVNEGQKTFIENINVIGNTRTLDEVVRREMKLSEGDPYNEDKIKNSEKDIKNLGYFSKVDVVTKKGSSENKTDVDVKVEEQSTGDMSIGAGYSTTEGALADFSISENNFMGKGQKLLFATTFAEKRNEFDFSFTEPYFLKRDLAAGVDLQHITRDLQDESSYDSKIKSGGLRLGYPLSEKWRQNLKYSLEEEEIYNVQSSASTYIQEQEGIRTTSMIAQTVSYDTRDNIQSPTEGYYFQVYTNFAGLGGNAKYYGARILGTYYYPLQKNWVVSALGELGFITGWGGSDVRINERFSLGGDRLRGFDDYGVGPRDATTSDALGGNQFFRGNVELNFPTGLPEELGVTGYTFSDFGTLWNLDDADVTVNDSASLRLSIGAGIAWKSPFGPIKINLSNPILKEDFDKEQKFRLSFGTKM